MQTGKAISCYAELKWILGVPVKLQPSTKKISSSFIDGHKFANVDFETCGLKIKKLRMLFLRQLRRAPSFSPFHAEQVIKWQMDTIR